MELDTLSLTNFRQFYGDQELSFASGGDQNVTVVHGSNGSGKTTLLNAFTWLFYETITLPKPDHVASERALAEVAPGENVTVRGELTFYHEDNRHTFSREWTVERDSGPELSGTRVDEDLTFKFVDESGNTKTRSNPSSAIEEIMPERLREIFFFDGETIDKMVANDQTQIQDAIRNIMGLRILDRAERHLGHVRREFDDEVQKYGSKELGEIVERKNELEDEIQAKKDEKQNLIESRTEAQSELDNVRDTLSSRQESRELEERRNSLEDDLDDVENDIDQINDEIKELIAGEGYLPFAMPTIEATAEMLNEKRKKGEIPNEIKTAFVEDLLANDECICGRPLPDGSEPRDNVAQWQEQSGSSELEEMAMKITGRLTELADSQEAFYEKLDDYMERRAAKSERKTELEEKIDEVSTRLKDIEGEDIQQLETRREELSDDIESYTRQIGAVEGKIEELESELNDTNRKREKAREENEKSDQANRRSQAAEYVATQVDQLYDRFQDEVRQSVNDRVNDIYQDIMAKDYFIEVSEEYTLKFKQRVKGNPDQEVAVSTGERQVASLSFIAALVSLARERYESDEDLVYFTGGIYPMVMDSPFGSLDPEYQQNVSQMAPNMAEQVIVMLTDSQWTDEVAGEMGPKAGEEYELVYHDPSEEDGTDFEYTQIKPVVGEF